jgi:hypothetical protein
MICFLYKHARFFIVLWYTLTLLLTRRPSTKIPRYTRTEQILSVIRRGRLYKEDPWNGNFDVLYCPSHTHRLFSRGERAGDCDDHAIYWATTLLRGSMAKRAWVGLFRGDKGDGKSGHAVCVYQREDGTYLWVDYGESHSCSRAPSGSSRGWAAQSAARMGYSKIDCVALIPVILVGNKYPLLGLKTEGWHAK